MANGLSKSRLQAFRQCPKRLWLAVHRPDLQEVSEATEQRLQIGFLKAVLPTIAPEVDYDALAIGDGGAASGAWRELYHSDISAEEWRAKLRAALAEYCQRDTLALVRLAGFLSGLPASLNWK